MKIAWMTPLSETLRQRCFKTLPLVIATVWACTLSPVVAADGAISAEAVSAFLTRHCVECHGSETAEGMLDLTALAWELTPWPSRRRWEQVHDRILKHEMPPMPYLVMPFVACESLQQRIDRQGPLDAVEILRIGMQTAHGLAASHAQGLSKARLKRRIPSL